jgi:hypothetical protein
LERCALQSILTFQRCSSHHIMLVIFALMWFGAIVSKVILALMPSQVMHIEYLFWNNDPQSCKLSTPTGTVNLGYAC